MPPEMAIGGPLIVVSGVVLKMVFGVFWKGGGLESSFERLKITLQYFIEYKYNLGLINPF